MNDEDVPWGDLKGGYGHVYDPRPALTAIEAGAGGWDELW